MQKGLLITRLIAKVDGCLRSLYYPEMETRVSQIESQLRGTCEWLFLHETFEQWRQRIEPVLWIKGKPGSGKSTLMKYLSRWIMSENKDHDNKIVLKFFFHTRGTSELQKTRLGLLQTLVYQLLDRAPSYMPGWCASDRILRIELT